MSEMVQVILYLCHRMYHFNGLHNPIGVSLHMACSPNEFREFVNSWMICLCCRLICVRN